MPRFTVSLSDRKRTRTVDADDPRVAAYAVIGRRLLTLRENSRNAARNATEFVYEAAVATGAKKGGATPFTNIRVYVSRA